MRQSHSLGLNPFSLNVNTRNNVLSAMAMPNNTQKKYFGIPVYLQTKAKSNIHSPPDKQTIFRFIGNIGDFSGSQCNP